VTAPLDATGEPAAADPATEAAPDGAPAAGAASDGAPAAGAASHGVPAAGAAPAGAPATGQPAVDAALAALDDAADLPPAEQVAAYEDAHRALSQTLSTIDQG